jgi:LysR family hydrogen peroxide-inducible transcriptional activator
MSYLPTLRQLQFLIALKDEGSFQAAARACGVTQSTLSAGVKDMENLLGFDVIDRTNRKKPLFTPLGQNLIKTGRKVIADLSMTMAQAVQAQHPFAWPLRMGMIPTIAPYWLPIILNPLRDAYPALNLQVHEMQSASLVEAVMQGDLDCAVLALPFATQDLHVQPLFKEDFVCAAPTETFADQPYVTMDDLQSQSLLLLSEGHCLRDHLLEACSLQTYQHQQNISATSLSTIIQLVAHGYGVTLLPDMVVQAGLLPDTIRIWPYRPQAQREIALIWRKQSPLERDIMLLADMLHRNNKKTDGR